MPQWWQEKDMDPEGEVPEDTVFFQLNEKPTNENNGQPSLENKIVRTVLCCF